ncbi:MAG TPA: MauE/DoxX family redox-associated membrane protein [Kiritimatiellia bacterium]|nr:MauE/DoxX family redox-associated membrane protein [Kiritimatiellia bacterium]HRZ12539.1 MauE/DoxX family redox-associated membrane protein [Kiritimatiellia bacterium]HSA17617.1 MauE/DoxX family redox-associated membrane protein [Kiritimatiellia bacterium]
MNRAWMRPAARWALAAVFLAAAVPKILTPHDFAVAVFRYQMLPHSLVNLAALFLPWLELLSALALVAVPSWRDAALVVLGGLLLVFTAAIAFNLYRGIDIACGCFTVKPGARHMGWWNLGRNFLLILAALIARDRRPGQAR